MKPVLIFFSAFVFLLSGCTKKVGTVCVPSKKAYSNPTLLCIYNPGVTVSYSETIQPILNFNCLPCHSYPGSGGFNLDSYKWVRPTALSGNLTGCLTGDPSLIHMPLNGNMDSCEIKTIVLWIKQGALNN